MKRGWIASFAYEWPVPTQTFHASRLDQWRATGDLHSVNAYRDAGNSELTLRTPRKVDLVRAAFLMMQPRLLRKLVGGLLAAGGRDNGEQGRFGFLHQAIVGVALGNGLRDTDVRCCHGTFIAAAGTITIFAAARAELPAVIEVHSPITLNYNQALLRWKCRQAERLLVISEYTHERLVQLGIAADKLFIVRCGAHLWDSEELGLLNSPSSPVYAVSVGSLVEKKGHDIAIRAVGHLAAKGIDLPLKIVGDGPLSPQLRALSMECGARVELLGAKDHSETLRLIAAASVGVLACRRTSRGDEDGIPVFLMECIAAGVPVVSTRVAGIPELLASGEAGWLVDPEDVAGLSAALQDAVEAGKTSGRIATAKERLIAEYDVVRNSERALCLIRSTTR